MKDTNLLILVILFAITFGAYLFAYIFSYTNRQVKQQQAQIPMMPYPWPPPHGPEPQRENMSIWPMAMFMFICAVLYLVYQYDGKAPDLGRQYTKDNRANIIESPHIRMPDGYDAHEESLDQVWTQSAADASVLASKSAQFVGYVVRQHADEILSPLHYDRGWGIKLVTKESSLRWMADFEAQLTPFLDHGRRKLLISSILVEEDVVLHRFYMGGFTNRQQAQSILRYVKRVAPDATLVQLDQVDSLRLFYSEGA
jgi:hypothetical protein